MGFKNKYTPKRVNDYFFKLLINSLEVHLYTDLVIAQKVRGFFPCDSILEFDFKILTLSVIMVKHQT